MKFDLENPVVELENVTVYKVFVSFGDGAWQKKLTLASWFGGEPKYDLRPWNKDMTKCGKGIVLEDSELYDLLCLIEDALDCGDSSDEDYEEECEDYEEEED